MPTCTELNPVSPPLSYSIVSFDEDDFDDPGSKVSTLKEAGFRVLTVVPTYEAETSTVPSSSLPGNGSKLRTVDAIRSDRTPSANKIRALAVSAILEGMHVRFAPHLDADVTLSENEESYWRGYLVFDPEGIGYSEVLLEPILELIREIGELTPPGFPECEPCFFLTLGSELETSLLGFPDSWDQIRNRLQRLRDRDHDLCDRLLLGHGINWDHFDRREERIKLVNKYNESLGTGSTNLTPALQRGPVHRYFANLDYVGVSFYPPLAGELPDGCTVNPNRWHQSPTDKTVGKLADLMEKQWRAKLSSLEQISSSVSISEAGIGSPDASKPWDWDDPEKMKSKEGRNVVRHYVRALARFVEDRSDLFRTYSDAPCLAYLPVTFWAVGQYDWLGLRTDEWKVDSIVDWIRGYNERTFPPGADEVGGCFIATAAFGTSTASEVEALRRFRDERLRQSIVGKALIRLYEKLSPPLADFLSGRESLCRLVRAMIGAIVEFTPIGTARRGEHP